MNTMLRTTRRLAAATTVAATILLAPSAAAQVPVVQPEPLVNQFIDDSYQQRSPAWWNALSQQLTLSLARPVAHIDAPALQNVIYFAANHADKVTLGATVPSLLTIYREHPEASYRLLALSALHQLGDDAAMEALRTALRTEPEGQVRRLTVAALQAHYRQ